MTRCKTTGFLLRSRRALIRVYCGLSPAVIVMPMCATFALLSAACSVVVSSPTAVGELSQQVADGKSVTIATKNGGVELIHDPAATAIEITARIRCAGETEEKAAERVKATRLVAVREESGLVRIGVEFPSDGRSGVDGGTFSKDGATIVVRAANLDGIDVMTTNGGIDVGAFAGPARLETSNGSIKIKAHAGPIEARSSNGAIRASGVRAPILADTSNGGIEISLADDAEGEIELDTSNGNVTIELGKAWQGTVTADTSNGRIELSGGEVVTKQGTRIMTVGDGSKAKATIDTSNGRVTVRGARK
ncbi:MAG: DUF4097 family beta strand repeat-containing protein [Planctomycetaceae bacterium]|nr:DUF4097 family beta strand repeat-containing protein [Planctomycetaceae bacterium]